ncbi:hypothetical protein Mp_8g01360 [Marchantia polymorpha subsp. ruderalis]|uniref:Uncharacterized protein n=1 Tax=Marchantia polymorpha TaxID=3197 RepID=A0A2R6WR95_MARPO|nr:hypothetical protein MARPO_0064s0062 [Marchantia polymorpha]BBN18292.1 hypothetical protein Mp_8g01360 [Marchantia polymorpha subsp. ruderalis]|eukprot:PTQ36380.1 hypothetical protein MARPO_0064s0062 [Marchantia polymorpha]
MGAGALAEDRWDHVEGTSTRSVESLIWAPRRKRGESGEMMRKAQREAGDRAAITSRSAQSRDRVLECLPAIIRQSKGVWRDDVVEAGVREMGAGALAEDRWDHVEGTSTRSVEPLIWAPRRKPGESGEMMRKAQREAGDRAAITSRSAQSRDSVLECLPAIIRREGLPATFL